MNDIKADLTVVLSFDFLKTTVFLLLNVCAILLYRNGGFQHERKNTLDKELYHHHAGHAGQLDRRRGDESGPQPHCVRSDAVHMAQRRI